MRQTPRWRVAAQNESGTTATRSGDMNRTWTSPASARPMMVRLSDVEHRNSARTPRCCSASVWSSISEMRGDTMSAILPEMRGGSW